MALDCCTNHDDCIVVYQTRTCPVCDMDNLILTQADRIDALNEDMDNLHNQISDLKTEIRDLETEARE